MSQRVELVFDFVSPNAYLIWYPLRDLLRETNTGLDILPAFLAGMHRLTGNAPPMIRDKDVKGKVEYGMLEFQRFIAKHQLDRFKMNPKFPFNSILLQRLLVAADEDGRAVQFIDAMLPEIWEKGLDVTDGDAVAEALTRNGFDAGDMIARAGSDEVKQKLVESTDKVVERGAFGIPTIWVGEEMFFGKERLEQIREELAKS
ncbi:2-hydroxychromene-2-carboxylate isomerase [Altererythrobacter lutimaris]|uniref:2-hydroxychromene-2-carboxylate isomerase n=1 Tax=Altererythrobacter lutimaris TaxID=2743979 RepID=A0A850HGY5_9SPHN|nr:2-hydroxychromene-2-carboxylate isomerase [Altererythrobacter lutimaris]NVE94192.1 2-hydroxychromene-2-carboxylate isomerase [Altererythrobacter lutimaris]